jgi:hypothetical protein
MGPSATNDDLEQVGGGGQAQEHPGRTALAPLPPVPGGFGAAARRGPQALRASARGNGAEERPLKGAASNRRSDHRRPRGGVAGGVKPPRTGFDPRTEHFQLNTGGGCRAQGQTLPPSNLATCRQQLKKKYPRWGLEPDDDDDDDDDEDDDDDDDNASRARRRR